MHIVGITKHLSHCTIFINLPLFKENESEKKSFRLSQSGPQNVIFLWKGEKKNHK